jgi:hypothetical protein
MRDLTNLIVSQSYQYLIQISGSEFQDGLGNKITGSIELTASLAGNATSASYALTSTSASYANNANSASYALNSTSASYALNSTSASYALTSTSASYANNATTATTASYAISSSADNATLQDVTDKGNVTTNTITISGSEQCSLHIINNITGSGISFEDVNTTNNLQVGVGALGNILCLRGEGVVDTKVGSFGIITSNISASGYVSGSEFIGNLKGNASTATTASYALTASNAPNYTLSTTFNAFSSSISSSVDNKIAKDTGTTYNTYAIKSVTQAEYDALTPDANTLYFII